MSSKIRVPFFEALAKPLESRELNIASFIKRREIDMIINIPKNNRETELKNDYLIRRMAVDFDSPCSPILRSHGLSSTLWLIGGKRG